MNRFVLPLVLGVAFAILAAINVSLYRRPATIAPIAVNARSEQSKPQRADAMRTASSLNPEVFSETFERPLFSSTRRKPIPVVVELEKPAPAATPPSPPAQPVSQAPAPALLGVSVTSSTSKALLMANGKQEANWLQNGEAIDGWTITAITKEDITMLRGEQSIRLFLYPEKMVAPGNGGSQ